ncbi:hypothetical protein M1116_03420 [Patescibacteria group bacterium]|nr:hypothetical protein [Patescibacteria group bacterium]
MSGDLKLRVETFIKEYFEFLERTRPIRQPLPGCNLLYLTWECCEVHKALRAEQLKYDAQKDELNHILQLGGIPILPSWRDQYQQERHYPPTAPYVGSQLWLEQLAEAVGLETLPEPKPEWWMERSAV